MPERAQDDLPPVRYQRTKDPRWLRSTNRASAAIIFCFALTHIAMHSLARVSPNTFNKASTLYQEPAAVFALTAIAGLTLFHALCGLRILAIDFTQWGQRNDKKLVSMVLLAWIVVFIPMAYAMLRYTLLTMFGDA